MTHLKKQLIVCLLLLGLTATVAIAEPQQEGDDTTLPEVVVTGASVSVPSVDQAKEILRQTPGGTQVISSEEYKTGRSTTVVDTLSFAPGVVAQTRTGAEESRVSIRGSGLQRTFHLRGIKLLQDGIPLNQADGGGDFQRIEPLATRYTEIYRGGNALRYGATTLGGAINFVSPTGYDADRIQARAEVGSFEYIRSQLSSGQVLGPLDYHLSLSQFKQDGFRVHSEQDTYKFFSNAGYKFDEGTETRFYVSYIEAKAKLPGSLTKTQLQRAPDQPQTTSVTGNQKRDFDYFRLANKTTFEGENQRLDLSTFYFHIDLFHPIFQVLDVESHDFGTNLHYTNDADLVGKRNRLVAGFTPTLGVADEQRHTNAGGNRGAVTGRTDQTAYNLDLYAEDSFYVMDQLALVGGLQLSYASRKNEDIFFGNGNDSGKTIYRNANPKAGLLYDLTVTSQLFMNYNRASEPPTFSELFNAASDFLPNKAQISHTFEAGTRGEEGRFNWDATYYHAWVKKELLSLSDGSGTPLGTVNASETTIHQGVELGAGVAVFSGLVCEGETEDRIVVHGVYNWNDFRFNGDPVFGTNRLPSIPEHIMRTELLYEHPAGFYGGPNIEAVFTHYPIDMANTFFADPYATYGFKIGYRTKKGFSAFIEGKNLSDKKYAASTGIVLNAAGRDTNSVYNPGNGRTWLGGVEWRW